MAADYVIVGAGSAGCVLAARLSEDPDVEVLLLEAGGQDTATELHIPAMFPLVFKSGLDWDLFGEREPGLGGRRLYLPRGRVIGGSGSINAMIYLRGHRADFDGWAADGCTGWSYDEVLPYFKRSEDNERGASEFHGVGWTAHGVRQPLHVPPDRGAARGRRAGRVRAHRGPQRRSARGRLPLPADPAERHALQHRGRVPPPRRRAAEPRGARRRLRRADRLRGRPRGRASSSSRDGARETVRAEREVIVSAGTYQSPVLLMLSGIGASRRPRVLRDPGAGGPAGRAQPAGPLHGERELPHGRAGAVRHLHARELRAPRARGPRPADLELPRGGRLLPTRSGLDGAGRRVPFRGGAVLRRGPDAAARQRLRVRPRDRQADVARKGRPADADGRTRSRRCSATS